MLLGFDIVDTKCAVVIGKPNPEGEIEIIDKQSLLTNLPANW